jgi:hypothetical protein
LLTERRFLAERMASRGREGEERILPILGPGAPVEPARMTPAARPGLAWAL